MSFLENADEADLRKESLLAQYHLVKRRTSANRTYDEGSHVMRFGERDIDLQEASDFMGRGNKGGFAPEKVSASSSSSASSASSSLSKAASSIARKAAAAVAAAAAAAAAAERGQDLPRKDEEEDVSVHQRDAELMPLWHAVMHAATPAERSAASRRLRAELDARDALDADVAAAARAAMTNKIQSGSTLLSTAAAAPAAAAAAADVALAAVRPAGQPLTDDWDCFKGMLEAWAGECGYLSQYGMKHGRTLANLCNAGVRPVEFAAAAATATTTSCRRRAKASPREQGSGAGLRLTSEAEGGGGIGADA